MKIRILYKTNFGFPSEWKAISLEENKEILISYRYGKIKLLDYDSKKELISLSKDDFDVGGYMDTLELIDILKQNKIEIEDVN